MRAIHKFAVSDDSTLSEQDRVKLAVLQGLNVTLGGGAGQEVTVAVVFGEANLMPANYAISAEFDQDVMWYVTAKTALGFTLHVNPRLAANTVAAGKVNLVIHA